MCYSAGLAACLMLAAFCTVRVSSTIYTTWANSTPDIEEAISLYKTAMQIDAENPEAPYFLGLRLIEVGRYVEAAPYLKESIRIGKAPSADFSLLATAQSLSGDDEGAEKTFAEAYSMYPRSPFVLTRYSALLRVNGKSDDASRHFERARKLNKRAANTWWALINSGPRSASDLAFRSDDYIQVMDLKPYDSIYAVIAERDIRYPDERIKFPFEKLAKPKP